MPMQPIVKEVKVALPREEAFSKFVFEFGKWWPSAYTWSQDLLQHIYIEPRVNGHCTEIGPFDFRCDWGRVLAYKENELLKIIWQISPHREPIPDPDQSSFVEVAFSMNAENSTIITLAHTALENHGKDGEAYQKALNSECGWDYILKSYVEYCEAV